MADAYTGNLSDYRATIPHVFTPNAFVILSNGLEAVLGAPHAPLEYFNEWKRIDDEEEPGVVSLDTLIKGTCRPARFLDIIENFIAEATALAASKTSRVCQAVDSSTARAMWPLVI